MSKQSVSRRALPGRPAFYAVLPFDKVNDLPIYKRYYRVIRSLKYREVIGLARALNVAYGTVLGWRYCRCTPSLLVMLLIIEWGKQGKPLEQKKREPSLFSSMV